MLILHCGVGDGEWQLEAGERFPFSRINEVKRGMPPPQVSAILGKPLEIRERDGILTWRYYERQTKTDEYLLFGKISVRKERLSSEAEAIISFGAGRVTDVRFRIVP